MRQQISAALKDAMKAKDQKRLSTLRLINAAIKDRDIALRTVEGSEGVGDAEVLAILAKMVKQRHESIRAYEEGGRLELAEGERTEITIIQEFMPKQLDDTETETAIKSAIAKTGADSIRDMGKVMGHLKEAYSGQLDFSKVGAKVKGLLG